MKGIGDESVFTQLLKRRPDDSDFSNGGNDLLSQLKPLG